MATNYPSAVDSFVNPSATDTLDSATVPHAAQHDNINDAMSAVQVTLGVNPQGSSATVVARLTALDSTVAGKAATNQTMYVGTTALAINRSSASQTLTGVSIDGNAGTVTNGVYTSTTSLPNVTSVNGTPIPASATLLTSTSTSSALTSFGTSPALTGTPTTPTAAVDTNTTQVASTAFVVGQGYAKTSSLAASATTDTTNASNITSGTLGVGQGGTGQTTLTSGNVLIGNGTSGVTTTAVAIDGTANTIVKTSPAGSITASNQINVNAGASSGAIRLLGSTSGASVIQAPAVASGTQTMPTTSGTLVSTGMTGASAQVADTMLVSGVTTTGENSKIVKTGSTGGISAGSGGVSASGLITTSGNITTSSTGSITSATTLTATGLNTAGVVTNTSAGLLQTSATLSGALGGTGVANTNKTITLGGNLTTSGANALTLTTTGTTSVTLPSGTGYLLKGSSSITDGYLLTNLQATNLSATVTQVTATYTVDSGSTPDYIIKINNSASAVITLPTPSSYPGRVLKFIHQSATSCTAPASSVVPLTSAVAGTSLFSSATTAGKWTELVSDGTNWLVVAQN